jgi:hypothetical protein
MKFNLSKNKKFLLSLLVIVIAYCNNINATVCKWDGCVPMYKNLDSWIKFFENHSNNDNDINKYSNNDLNYIIENCDYWEGQWPLNCPMQLVNNDNIVMWTDEYLKEINYTKSQYQLQEWQCEVPDIEYEYGPFAEVINFSSAKGKPKFLPCHKVYKLHPFLPQFILIIAREGNKITFLNTSTGQIYYNTNNDDTIGEDENIQALNKLLSLISTDETAFKMIKFYPPSQFFSPYIFDRLLKYFKPSQYVNKETYQKLLSRLNQMLVTSPEEDIEQIQKVDENGKVVWLVLNWDWQKRGKSGELPPRVRRLS